MLYVIEFSLHWEEFGIPILSTVLSANAIIVIAAPSSFPTLLFSNLASSVLVGVFFVSTVEVYYRSLDVKDIQI